MAILGRTAGSLSLLIRLPLLLLPFTPLSAHPAAAHNHPQTPSRFSTRRDLRGLKGFEGYLRSHERGRLEAGTNAAADTDSTMSAIEFHGAGVLTGATKVYLIYYGSWQGSSPVIENFIDSLSKTSTTPQVGWGGLQ